MNCRFEISDCRFQTLCGAERGHENGYEFVRLSVYSKHLFGLCYAALLKKFDPKQRFISFLKHNAEFRNEVCGRARATDGAIVRAH